MFVPPFEPVVKFTTVPTGSTDGRGWLKALYLALIAREWHWVDDLRGFPTERLRRSRTRNGEFTYRQVDLLKSLLPPDTRDHESRMRAPDATELLKAALPADAAMQELFRAALDRTEPSAVPGAFIDQAQCIAAPEINLAAALSRGDAADFNDVLANALEAH